MSEEGSIFNFMALVQESEAKEAQAPEAPFKLEQQNQKIIFQKVRAKNFRSVGNEWMEIDFLKSKSTLVVSEDNGSGKSTLTVWAPYYALFDKPYNPKELKAALVNSSTNKDAMVELFFNARGKNWMVRRGYKPSVFEIFSQDQTGEWVKDQAPAAMKDQQKYLESIIGFDAKIAENVMILGADKFTPFIEMDAPSRRHVVEKIWDLAVFPVMLKVAKEEHVELVRERDERSASIDSVNERLRHTHELLEQVLSKREYATSLRSRIGEMTQKIAESEEEHARIKTNYESRAMELKAESVRIDGELVAAASQVQDAFEERLQSVKERLAQVKAWGDEELEKVLSSLEPELQQLRQELQQQEAEELEAIRLRTEEGSAAYAELAAQLKNAEIEADRLVAKMRKERPPLIFSKEEEMAKTIKEISKLKEMRVQLCADDEAASLSLQQYEQVVRELRSQQTVVSSQREEKRKANRELLSQIEKFEHIGTCPTCAQVVGEEAISAFKASMSVKLKETETEDLDNAIASLQEQIDKASEICQTYANKHTQIILRLEECDVCLEGFSETLKELENEQRAEMAAWEGAAQALEATARADYTMNTRSKINELVSQTKVSISELKADWEERKRATRSLIDNHASKVARVKAEETVRINAEITAAESEFRTVESDFKAELAKQTADLTAKRDSINEILVDSARGYTQAAGRLLTDIKSMKEMVASDQEQLDKIESDIDDESQKRREAIHELETDLLGLSHDHQTVSERIEVYKRLIVELGDKAAKAEIIKAYMPFLNHKVNEYLDALNLHVGFKMDENFSIEFTAPDRKRQTTWSLSKGQAMRMNLAMLFALRDVANLKASVSTNLLIMDETLEALSERGVREIAEMFEHRFRDINMFVVTQRKAEFSEYFEATINYGLRGGFTVQLV